MKTRKDLKEAYTCMTALLLTVHGRQNVFVMNEMPPCVPGFCGNRLIRSRDDVAAGTIQVVRHADLVESVMGLES